MDVCRKADRHLSFACHGRENLRKFRFLSSDSPMNETVFFYIGMHNHVHGRLKVGMCVTSKVHVGLDIYLHAPNQSAIVVTIIIIREH